MLRNAFSHPFFLCAISQNRPFKKKYFFKVPVSNYHYIYYQYRTTVFFIHTGLSFLLIIEFGKKFRENSRTIRIDPRKKYRLQLPTIAFPYNPSRFSVLFRLCSTATRAAPDAVVRHGYRRHSLQTRLFRAYRRRRYRGHCQQCEVTKIVGSN